MENTRGSFFFCRKILMEGQTEEEETIAHVYMSDTL